MASDYDLRILCGLKDDGYLSGDQFHGAVAILCGHKQRSEESKLIGAVVQRVADGTLDVQILRNLLHGEEPLFVHCVAKHELDATSELTGDKLRAWHQTDHEIGMDRPRHPIEEL